MELRGLTVDRCPVGGRGGRQLEPLDEGQLLPLGHGGVVRDGGPARRGEGSSSPVTRIAHRIENNLNNFTKNNFRVKSPTFLLHPQKVEKNFRFRYLLIQLFSLSEELLIQFLSLVFARDISL